MPDKHFLDKLLPALLVCLVLSVMLNIILLWQLKEVCDHGYIYAACGGVDWTGCLQLFFLFAAAIVAVLVLCWLPMLRDRPRPD